MAICEYCGKEFTLIKNLYAHFRNIHEIDPVIDTRERANNNLQCSQCASSHKSYTDFRNHFVGVHNYELYKETQHFDEIQVFLSWKEQKEMELKCSYVKNTGIKCGVEKKITYYVCHRSGTNEQSKKEAPKTSKKTMKSQGLAKMDFPCPSTLELTEEDGRFKAVLFTPHIGHQCSLTHINLSKAERTRIAGKIAEGVSFDNILDDIRNNISNEKPLERIQLLNRQDLRNIQKEFLLQNTQFHKNDAVSVDLWVNHMSKLNDESPVLFYKSQGTEDSSETFKKDDFILILMTAAQVSLLKQFGGNKICIDSTHGTNKYDFLLTSLLIVDEYGEGIPVAFLISNWTDTITLTHFFSTLKDKVGSIKTEVFMSDDAPEFYNAWENVMVTPTHRLLCIWHVDRNWRKQLQKVQGDQEMKARVYKCLRMLMEVLNQNEFAELLESVLHELFSSESTKTFGEYFKEYYSGRPVLWAYCFRKGLGISTNMYLEAMHKVLKHVYLEGKKAKRVDKCISALMKLVRDKIFNRLAKKVKGKLTYRIKEIHDRHLRRKTIKSANITQKDHNTWEVKSSNREDTFYIVRKVNDTCPNSGNGSSCQLVCKQCKVCIHIFSCECTDYYIRCNLCKHVHAICDKFNIASTVPSPTEDFTETEQEAQKTLIAEHNVLTENLHKHNERIKEKLDLLYGYASNNLIGTEEAIKVEKSLDTALNVLTKTSPPDKEPSNKNVTKQLRFGSTKRKRETCSDNKIKKPSTLEKETFQNLLVNRDLYGNPTNIFFDKI